VTHLTADDVADLCQGAKRIHGGWIVRCPVHEDRSPSLSIRRGKKGTVLHCHAACSNVDIAAALGFRMAQLFEDYNHSGGNNTDIDQQLRSMIRDSRKDAYVPQTLGAVMGKAFTGPHEDWFRTYELHWEWMDMDWEVVSRYQGTMTVVMFEYLSRWWDTLDPRTRDWRIVREGAMRKLDDTYREAVRYANGF